MFRMNRHSLSGIIPCDMITAVRKAASHPTTSKQKTATMMRAHVSNPHHN